MRTIETSRITDVVADLLVQACIDLPGDIEEAIRSCRALETDPQARATLDILLENAALARKQEVPICQDTGLAFVIAELGADCHVSGGVLTDAVQDGIRRGTERGWLRRSIVRDPVRRENTGDNAPGVVVVVPVAGDKLRLTVAPKGAGCENMSKLAMLAPAAGVEGVKEFAIETICSAGANPCPPVVVGIGLGGDFSSAPLLAKKAMLRTVGARNPDPLYAALERELLAAINGLGLGPQGMGGTTTALEVFIEVAPCHIASLPVAICLNCHAARHASIAL